MKTKKYIYPAMIIFSIVFLIAGCSWLKGYGKVRLPSENEEKVTIQSLKDNWNDYTIFYAGMSVDNPAGIWFDPKNDDKKLVGDRWIKVKDRETVAEIISWIQTCTLFYPRLHIILGPDNQFYGYLFYAWGDAAVKVVDDTTLYVYDLESPNYINDPSGERREMAGKTQ